MSRQFKIEVNNWNFSIDYLTESCGEHQSSISMKSTGYSAIAKILATSRSEIPSLDDSTKCSLQFKSAEDGKISLQITKLFVDFIFTDFTIVSGFSNKSRTTVLTGRHEPIGMNTDDPNVVPVVVEYISDEGFEIIFEVKTKALSSLRFDLDMTLTVFVCKLC